MCLETSLFAAEGRTIHDVAQDSIVIQVFVNLKMHLVRWTSCVLDGEAEQASPSHVAM